VFFGKKKILVYKAAFLDKANYLGSAEKQDANILALKVINPCRLYVKMTL